jgi:hypothetical protein
MALEVNVNSYVTVDEAESYFETRLDVPAWYSADNEDKESSLVTATQLIDELAFKGSMTSLSQELAWPRSGVIYYSPRAGQLIEVSSNEIPKVIKTATFEVALHLLTNQDLLNADDQTFERIKVGPIEIEDSISNHTKAPTIPSRVKNTLRPIMSEQGVSKMWWRAN